MTENKSDGSKSGCFAWLIRAKRSVNERWAKARNSLRQKLARRSRRPVTPGDLVNDTGCPDMEITKVSVSTPPDRDIDEQEAATPVNVPSSVSQTPISPEVDVSKDNSACDTEGDCAEQPDLVQVRAYVLGIINSAVRKIEAETTPEKPAYDKADVWKTDSVTSSLASVIADVIVADSLTQLVHDDGTKGDNAVKPRTVTEMLERHDIDPNIGKDQDEDALPPCLP